MARSNPATGTKHAADASAKSAAYGDGMLHPAPSGSVVVVGAGMVAHRFVESLTSRDTDGRWSVTVLGDEARGRFNVALRRIARTYLDDDADDAARAETARYAAGVLLDTFPHTSRRLPDEVLAPRNASLRLAIEHVHGRAHEPITPSDVARHAGLTPRGLQQAFSRHLDTTPSEYLRAVRLDRVREELVEGRPDTVTVAEVATRWAFAHLGRFSASYVHRFDEYPRETLHRT